MKKVFSFLIALVIMSACVKAQDIITKRNGDEIKAKVTEVGTTEIKYKRSGNETGPTYTLPKSEIFMVKYENGEKDIFQTADAEPEPEQKPVPVKEVAKPKEETIVVRQQPTRQTVGTARPVAQTRTVEQTPRRPAAPVDTRDGVLTYPDRRGYAGFILGVAIPVGNIGDADFVTGGQFALDFGVLFSKNVGVTALIFGTSHSNSYNDDASTGLIGFLTGPLFSFPLSPGGRVEFDLKPLVGFAQADLDNGSKHYDFDTRFAFGSGATFRFNLSRRFSLSANLNYINSTVDKKDLHINYEDTDFSVLGITVGANIRF
ncbi:MAG: porin family protein [Dysgonamonadaceae bacterium]|jgi:hypothetical protein|nr:porin family protein [Dysgonamonadaceae bacterium]